MEQASAKTGGHRALIVDDDDFQVALLIEQMAQAGWNDVRGCSGGQEALQVLQREGASAVELLLVDLHMPGMDGFEFMAALETVGFRGAVIIVSGQSSEVLHSASLVAQLGRFKLLGTLPKPVQTAALAAMLAGL